MVDKIMQEKESDILERLQQALLLTKFPYVFSTLTADATYLGPIYKADGAFFEITHPAPNIVDIMIGRTYLPTPYTLALSAAIKFELLRFCKPLNKTYSFDKIHLWEKNIFSLQVIVKHIQAVFGEIIQDLNTYVDLFYGRLHLNYHTLTYIDCGFGNFIHLNSKGKEGVIIDTPTCPLGKQINKDFRLVQRTIHPGDCLVFCLEKLKNNKRAVAQENIYPLIIQSLNSYIDHSAYQIVAHLKRELAPISQTYFQEEGGFLFLIKLSEKNQEVTNESSAKFASTLDQLQAVRSFVRHVCQQAPGDTEKLGFQLQIAINELFCNIVKHAYHGQVRGEIIIESQLKNDGIYFTLSDQGALFNPINTKHPNLTGKRESGFGFYIIQQIADQISYQPKTLEDNWNHLRIFKRYFFEEEQMEFLHRIENDVLIILPQGGNLDATNASSFKENIFDMLPRTQQTKIVFDLSRLEFIDSSGLGVFLSIQRNLGAKGGILKLAHLNKSIRTMFEIVSMHRIFDIFPNVEEAIKSFNS